MQKTAQAPKCQWLGNVRKGVTRPMLLVGGSPVFGSSCGQGHSKCGRAPTLVSNGEVRASRGGEAPVFGSYNNKSDDLLNVEERQGMRHQGVTTFNGAD